MRTYDNHIQWGEPPTIKWRATPDHLTALCYTPRIAEHGSEEALAEQAARPKDLFAEAREQVDAYVTAFDHQVGVWRARLHGALTEWIARQQRLLRRDEADRLRVQELLEAWRVGPIEVHRAATNAGAIPASEPTPALALPSLLADSSFDDIVWVVNRWVEAVERHRGSYLELLEERLSDQIVACLNGAFGRADREVLIGRGRTDFCVTANMFGIDGVADVFAGEAKFWSGEKSLLAAMKLKQSLNNLTRRTRSAMLVVFVRDRQSFIEVEASGLRALDSARRSRGRLPDRKSRPCYQMASPLDPAVTVELCVVFVDLTTPEQLPSAVRRRRGATENAVRE